MSGGPGGKARLRLAIRVTLMLLLATVVVSPPRSSLASTERPDVIPAPVGGTAHGKRAFKQSILRATGILRYGGTYRASSGYDRFQYVVVTRDAAYAAARLPGVTLVYMSGTSIKRHWSTGVSYDDASANGWLLQNGNGSSLSGLNESIIADVGNPAYQKRWVDNVSGFVRRTGVRGVFIDDVLADPRIETDGAFPAKYPTSATWEEAMVSFIAHVGDALRAKGYYVVVNAVKFISGDARSDDGTFAREFAMRLAPHVSGIAAEYWLQAPSDLQLRAMGSTWHDHWSGWESLLPVVQRAGADFFGLMYGTSHDLQAMRFGRGSFLLDWNGKGGAFMFSFDDQSDPYQPAWVTQLGLPRGKKFLRSGGVWERRYGRGIVLVNPTRVPVTVRVLGVPRSIAGTDSMFVGAGR